jgi:putative oxidoreductase
VHAGNGVFGDAGGEELVAALGAVSLTLAAVGAGRFSVDGLLETRRADRRTRATATV